MEKDETLIDQVDLNSSKGSSEKTRVDSANETRVDKPKQKKSSGAAAAGAGVAGAGLGVGVSKAFAKKSTSDINDIEDVTDGEQQNEVHSANDTHSNVAPQESDSGNSEAGGTDGDPLPTTPPGGWAGTSQEHNVELASSTGSHVDPPIGHKQPDTPPPTEQFSYNPGETIPIHDSDIISEYDTDGDGVTDVITADIDNDGTTDLILDTDKDGSFDTVVANVQLDEDGNLSIGATQQNTVAYVSDDPVLDPNIALNNDPIQDPTIALDQDPQISPVTDPGDDDSGLGIMESDEQFLSHPMTDSDESLLSESYEQNPDLDLQSSTQIDINMPFDNDMIMDEYV